MLHLFVGTNDRAQTNRELTLMLSTIAFTALIPLSEDFPLLKSIAEIVTIVAAVAVCATSRRTFVIAMMLGVPAAVLSALDTSRFALSATAVSGFAFETALWLYVAVLMLARIFRTRVVTRETLYLAVSSYMALGFVWSIAYVVVELASRGSFTFPAASSAPAWANLYYFSFVTLTTLGYGDVVPIGSAARSLAILEAIAGQMFLGMLIARLVGRLGRGSPSEETA